MFGVQKKTYALKTHFLKSFVLFKDGKYFSEWIWDMKSVNLEAIRYLHLDICCHVDMI